VASRQRRGREGVNIWPGFVDALATVLLAFIFLILIFVVAQFYLSSMLSQRNSALAELQNEVSELSNTLAMERRKRRDVEAKLADTYDRLHSTLAKRDQLRQSLEMTKQDKEQLKSELTQAEEQAEVSAEKLRLKLREIASLQADIDALRQMRDKLEGKVGKLAGELEASETRLGQVRDRSKALRASLAQAEERTNLAQESVEEKSIRIERLVAQIDEQDAALSEQKKLTANDQARIDQLRANLKELRNQLSSVRQALELSEETVANQKTRIENLGQRLNIALAERVKELEDYRSEFFGRLREVLGDLDSVRVVGDRFMFQSELFFDTASAGLGQEGRDKLDRLAETLKKVSERIPGDLPWVLQVEGHTDQRPIDTAEFPSNWELSTARATNIVHYLVEQGISPKRLAAAGYGPYQPLVEGDDSQAYARNRRIELRLTQR